MEAESGKERERPSNTDHMNDVRCEVDIEGKRGPHSNNALDHIVKCSFARQDIHKIAGSPLELYL